MTKLIDLSHDIEDGMVTYKGLPAPIICDFLSREQSRNSYADGTEFNIAKIEMVANTGTYIDAPFHRFADGCDIAGLSLDNIANIDGIVIDATNVSGRAVGVDEFIDKDVSNKAVLVKTGWDKHWRTDQYFEDHSFLTEEAAIFLRDSGATLVGIDSHNIDNTDGGTRPVHTVLLAAGIPIVEHMTNLQSLPTKGFKFFAVPPKIKQMGTFPVRAHAKIEI